MMAGLSLNQILLFVVMLAVMEDFPGHIETVALKQSTILTTKYGIYGNLLLYTAELNSLEIHADSSLDGINRPALLVGTFVVHGRGFCRFGPEKRVYRTSASSTQPKDGLRGKSGLRDKLNTKVDSH